MKPMLLAVLAALSALPPPASASITATQELKALRQASGGARWKDVAAIVADGSVQQDGMTCTIHDVVALRSGYEREDTHCPAFSTADGIDARGAWKQDRSGQVHSLDSPEAKALTVTDRWLNRLEPLFSDRQPSTLKTLAPTAASGIRYARIDASPRHGRTVRLWIDAKSHRLVRTTMRRSFQTVTIRYDDYRDVKGLRLPFRITSAVGKPPDMAIETIVRYELLSDLHAHALARPSNVVTDVQLPGGRAQLPLSFSPGGKLLVEARINGRGPFPFVLDTGGHAILTPTAARSLHLEVSGSGLSRGAGAGATRIGYARVDSIQLGEAKIADQSVLVMPMSPILTDRGDQPPVAGILGLEVFERFAVTIDLAKKLLILQPFATAKPPAEATALPIYFTGDMPLVYATLDGKRGIFGIDTGNSGPLMLFPDWADDNDLARYYRSGLARQDGGVGGMFTAHAAYIRSLKLGKLPVRGELVGLLTPSGVGATSNPSEAGNLGMTVWGNFRMSIDYHRGRIYLVPRRHFVPEQPTATSGMVARKLSHDAFTVLKVTANGAAAKAGLVKGDKIVAVDGTAARHLASLYLYKHCGYARPGTKIELTLASGRRATVVLTSNAAIRKALHPRMK